MQTEAQAGPFGSQFEGQSVPVVLPETLGYTASAGFPMSTDERPSMIDSSIDLTSGGGGADPEQAFDSHYDLTDANAHAGAEVGLPASMYDDYLQQSDDEQFGEIGGGADQEAFGIQIDEAEESFSIQQQLDQSRAKMDEQQKVEKEIFTPYSCPKLPYDFCNPHCGEVVETATLAAVEPPDVTHELLIPESVLRAGRLSDLQTEAVLYAGQRHSQFLADGFTRGGFMLGDGTGVGKGRTCAGICYDYFLHKRRDQMRHKPNSVKRNKPIVCLWVSVSWDLIQDARRDMKAITVPLDGSGGASDVAMPVVSLKDAQAASFVLGSDYARTGIVVFCTYTTFSRGDASVSLKALKDLLGDPQHFDGVIAFDEAHQAKNLVAGRGKSSKTAMEVLKLQNEYRGGRVVYASATGASEVRNMGYMCRLGLWGPGTAFSHFSKDDAGSGYGFLDELQKGGFGAMELVGMDLKAQGRYLCRTLSFRGATFTVSEARLDAAQRKVYDDAAALWQRLIVICKNGRFWAAIENVNLRTFWAAQQMFFRQLLCAFKVPHTIRLIREALNKGGAVIVGIQLTGDSRVAEMLKNLLKEQGETAADDEEENEYAEGCTKPRRGEGKGKSKAKKKTPAAAGPELDDAFSSTKDTFIKLIERCWATTENVSVALIREMRSKAKTIEEALAELAPAGSPPASRSQVRRHSIWADLASKAEQLKLPVNPIDGIIQEFGTDVVAEVTGRRLRAELRENGKVEYVARAAAEGLTKARLNLAEQQSFLDDKKQVIIISQAGSSGISLHAGFDFVNQRQRTHVILELPWSSEQLIQQCGRSHRSNQICAPDFLAISTDVAGETRFAMSVAARMQSLGALTKSDRRAAHCTSEALSRYNFCTLHGRNALREIQIRMQLQALLRLSQPNKQQQQHRAEAIKSGQLSRVPPLVNDGDFQWSESQKQRALAMLGLPERATSEEMREQFISRGILCFVERQMADRDYKQNFASKRKEQTERSAKIRSQAAGRLLSFANSYKIVSNERQIPVQWSPEDNMYFPIPIRRVVGELLLVFKRKEQEWGVIPKQAQALIIDKLASSWLHPPEPPIEFFCLLLLLDVVKAPAARRNSVSLDNSYNFTSLAKSTDSKLTIETFFNRMLIMNIANQKRVFSYFMDLHENELASAAADGESALAGITDVGSGSQRATLLSEPRLICREPASNSAVCLIPIQVECGDRRMGYKTAWRKLKECGETPKFGSHDVDDDGAVVLDDSAPAAPARGAEAISSVVGFYQQQRSKRVVLVVKERAASTYAMWRPSSRLKPERRRLAHGQIIYRLRRFNLLSEKRARLQWIKEWRKITAYSTEQYHLITGPVLGCWQVIKDCASRVPNEADPQADLAGHSRPGEDRSAASDEPDTTISIVKAILPNNRRVIGLSIEEQNVDYVVQMLQQHHATVWQRGQQQIHADEAASQRREEQQKSTLGFMDLTYAAPPDAEACSAYGAFPWPA